MTPSAARRVLRSYARACDLIGDLAELGPMLNELSACARVLRGLQALGYDAPVEDVLAGMWMLVGLRESIRDACDTAEIQLRWDVGEARPVATVPGAAGITFT